MRWLPQSLIATGVRQSTTTVAFHIRSVGRCTQIYSLFINSAKESRETWDDFANGVCLSWWHISRPTHSEDKFYSQLPGKIDFGRFHRAVATLPQAFRDVKWRSVRKYLWRDYCHPWNQRPVVRQRTGRF